MKSLPFFSVLIVASGCVRLSTYRKLQDRQEQTAQDLRRTQARVDELKQDNDKLSAELSRARKEMKVLVSDMHSDLEQAQKGIAAAFQLLEKTGDAVVAPTASSATAVTPASGR